MSKPEFVHLHLHTHYSILDGLCQIPPLLEQAKAFGMKSLAITDHGAMYGAIEFYTKAEKKGIKPILGFEAYVAPGSRFDRENPQGMKEASYHLTLLAKDYTGYRNLSKLCTAGFLEGFYYHPRIDKELLRHHAEGIIALSGCLSSEISRACLADREEEAERVAREYLDILGEGNFFLEVQDNGLPEQKILLPRMATLSRRTGIPLVATSDVHYLLPEHAKVQDVLLCINTGKRLDEENRMKMRTDNFFFKNAEQMRLTFRGYEEACDRTVEIASRCNLEIPLGEFHLPKLTPPAGMTDLEYLRKLCEEGLRERYGDPLPEAVKARYEKEIAVIAKMGFVSYFLIVWDLVKFARDHDIAIGPGRGSAAGSIVAYALRITNLDPLRYGLLFERFLNEGRREMPDIDLDFDKERRQEVIQHIIHRHGEDHCAKIITFGSLSGRSAVRDVGRVLGLPLHEVDTLAKMIPDRIEMREGKNSIQIAMEMNPDLAEVYHRDPQIKELLDIAGNLDGVIRQTGIHAAGVLVADKPIVEYGPLAKRGEEITTQYEMKVLGDVLGLCKIDILGLETLTLLRKTIELIRTTRGITIDLDAIPLDDAQTYAMLSEGDAKGIFQFESAGFRDLLTKLKPDRFEDLVAAVAMYRPGPLEGGYVETYIQCKHGKAKPSYLHPKMEPILRETFGLILYQEQVQALALELAHFTLSEGDLMRRAMGKKIPEIMEQYRGKFVAGARSTIGEEAAKAVFDQIARFAGYGFNKSHSACYALIAYQTAYLKRHYPTEYMAALLTVNRGDTAKVVSYIEDARQMGIEVLPPDINESGAYFTPAGDTIRFGLSAVKGVGDKAVEALEAERREHGPFRDLYDFCERVDLHLLNKGVIEALIKAGAFDSLGGHRAQYMAALESALAAGNVARKNRNAGQMGLFGSLPQEPIPLPNVPRWSDQQLLQMEKEVLGFYVSSHPLARHAGKIRHFATATTATLAEKEDGSLVTIGGLIAEVRLRTDKNNRRYAQIVLEDMEGVVTVWIFNKTYETCRDLLHEDAMIFVQGKLDRSREEPTIKADLVIPFDEVEERLTDHAVLTLDAPGLGEDQLDALQDLLRAHRGEVPLYLRVRAHNRRLAIIRTGREFSIKPSARLKEEITRLLGENRLLYSVRGVR